MVGIKRLERFEYVKLVKISSPGMMSVHRSLEYVRVVSLARL
jgi:hypothetical protein